MNLHQLLSASSHVIKVPLSRLASFIFASRNLSSFFIKTLRENFRYFLHLNVLGVRSVMFQDVLTVHGFKNWQVAAFHLHNNNKVPHFWNAYSE